MHITPWATGLFAMVLCAPLLAQEPIPTLTEQAAVEAALAQHPLLQVVAAEVGMAGSRARMARSEGRVQVAANGYAGLSNMGAALPIPGSMPQSILGSQDRASLDLNATAMVPLSTGGRIEQNVKAAELSAAAVEDSLASARVQVAYEARVAYADWCAALAMQKVADDELTAQQKQVVLSQHLFDVGSIPKFDLLRSEAAAAAAQQKLTNAKAEVAAATARLAQAMGAAQPALAVPGQAPMTDGLPVRALETAFASRPDLLAARKQVAAARATVLARQGAYKPQLYGMAMVDGLAPNPMDNTLGVMVGLVAGIPLVDGGRRQAEVQEAAGALKRAEATLSALELQVRAEVAAAEARASAARQNLGTAAAQVTSAEEAYRVAQVRYEAGKSVVVELLDALRAQTEAQQSLVLAQAQYARALADLYRAMGVVGPPRD